MQLLHKLCGKGQQRIYVVSGESLAWTLPPVRASLLVSCRVELKAGGRKERGGRAGRGERKERWADGKGRHTIKIDHRTMGQTCGILPVGIAKAVIKTEGLKWNMGEFEWPW